MTLDDKQLKELEELIKERKAVMLSLFDQHFERDLTPMIDRHFADLRRIFTDYPWRNLDMADAPETTELVKLRARVEILTQDVTKLRERIEVVHREQMEAAEKILQAIARMHGV
jgi:hypothetical protein